MDRRAEAGGRAAVPVVQQPQARPGPAVRPVCGHPLSRALQQAQAGGLSQGHEAHGLHPGADRHGGRPDLHRRAGGQPLRRHPPADPAHPPGGQSRALPALLGRGPRPGSPPRGWTVTSTSAARGSTSARSRPAGSALPPNWRGSSCPSTPPTSSTWPTPTRTAGKRPSAISLPPAGRRTGWGPGGW